MREKRKKSSLIERLTLTVEQIEKRRAAHAHGEMEEIFVPMDFPYKEENVLEN